MIEEEEIPEHWDIETIEDVVDNASIGGTPLRSEDKYWGGDIPWISSGAVSAEGKYTTPNPDEGITEQGLEESSAKFWSEGTVLVAMHGQGTLGHSAIASIDTTGNQSICGLQVDGEKIDNEYLYYWLQNIREPLANKGRGATASRQNLNQSLIIETKVPVPPLDEQRQIVENIEQKLDRIERLKKSVENIGRLSQEYEESFLAYAISGVNVSNEEVNIQGLPNPDNEKIKYDVKQLGDVVNYHSNLTDPTKKPEKEYELVELGDIERDAGGITNVQNKKGEKIGSSKREFNNNHILYCKLRPYLNKVVKPTFSGIASSELLVLEPKEQITKDYLYFYLSSPMVRDKAEFIMKGANQPRVSKSELLEFNIVVPPINKQKEIVNSVKKIKSGKRETSIENLNSSFKEYRASLLYHAFTGNLESD
jgi:type I restriction enzyme S subunit